MVGITTYLWILTVSVNGLNSPSKVIDWQAGLKKKTPQFVVYNKPISPIEISIGLSW
jgi:hypothetical protein